MKTRGGLRGWRNEIYALWFISFSRITLHGDINSTNLHCLASVLPGNTSDSRNSSFIFTLFSLNFFSRLMDCWIKCYVIMSGRPLRWSLDSLMRCVFLWCSFNCLLNVMSLVEFSTSFSWCHGFVCGVCGVWLKHFLIVLIFWNGTLFALVIWNL